jgi:FkbM family methyltransferase
MKEYLINLCPRLLQPPVRYYYRKLKGTLDKELLKLNELVDHNKLAIDVGANYGMYTYGLSRFFEQVEAFEPQPECAETIIAYSNFLAKVGKNNINVYKVGLSNMKGLLTLNIPIKDGKPVSACASFNNLDSVSEKITVPVFRLDDFDFRNVSLIKIDVEGHESKVLEGGRETILREKPVLLIEIEQRHIPDRPIVDVFNEIIGYGYTGSFLYKNEFVPLSRFSYETHQQPFLNNTLCKDYINNFIFKPIK